MGLPEARVLAIESSCDETAAAIIENGRTLLGSSVASQMEMHARFGGVFPEVASRQHILSIVPVVDKALKEAHLTISDLDAIAATRGPGLAGSLLVGLNMAKGLAMGSNLPLVGVNHLEGHLYSAWVRLPGEDLKKEPRFPLMALLVSGGHTELVLMKSHHKYIRLLRVKLLIRLPVCWDCHTLEVLPYNKLQRTEIPRRSSFPVPGWKIPGIFLSVDLKQLF